MDKNYSLFQLPVPSARVPTCIHWGQLYGSAQGLAVNHALNTYDGSVCIITKSASTADRLKRELDFFWPDNKSKHFVDYETLPYDTFSPPQNLLSERLSTLYQLNTGDRQFVIANAQTLLTKLPPPEYVSTHSMVLATGEELDGIAFRKRLIDNGYLHVEQVFDPGDFAVRGSLIDIYPTGSDHPVRIDLFGDEIEKLRIFDPHSQLSTDVVEKIQILPAKEFPFNSSSIRKFRTRYRQQIPGDPGLSTIYKDISDARLPAGIEYYLPLFFDSTSSLIDYLHEDTLIILGDEALSSLDSGWGLIKDRYEQLGQDPERPILPPDIGFWNPENIQNKIERFPRITINSRELEKTDKRHFNAGTNHPLSIIKNTTKDPLSRWIDTEKKYRTLLVTSSPGRKEVISELLRGRNIVPTLLNSWTEFLNTNDPICLTVGDIESGLVLPTENLRLITAEQVGLDKPRQKSRKHRSKKDPDSIIRELTDLRVGASVVHEEHGIGRYLGLVSLEINDVLTEFLMLEYAESAKLYIPVHNLHLITRYTGASSENAPLHRLGSDQWVKAKRKAAQKARDVAAELLALYAQRAARRGISFPISNDIYQSFIQEFPFQETDDQLKAINETINDLESDKPMDRVVCGDVGFGKTEVALRAAFIAVQANYQVCLLVPTTLLAQQHHRTFTDRFSDWPVRIESLSRLKNRSQIKETLLGLSDGTVDIVIGTHKLLSDDINFKKLGLVIVDEEHRFGVRQKERLKNLRSEIDMLTLTATPIPRTLNMTLGGLRDLSLITTPPIDRLSVKTYIGEWRNQSIREAVLRELRRGGQIYFVHNRVQEIEKITKTLKELLPEAEIQLAHGKMPEKMLERVMLDFYNRKFNLLVCSTIIESGIDIQTANTIIINRADRLGLAQLHQLRGRVGRSHHQAYAYLITPPTRSLTPDAEKRLEAIEALEELGSGFTLATHDLEIRGAGELLGEDQSGQIQAVGFTLYNDLLNRAVKSLRDGSEPELKNPIERGPDIDIGLPALIPESYMPDIHMRLVHYKRIASADCEKDLQELQVEFINRFGLLPESLKMLFEITKLKLVAISLAIKKIRIDNTGGFLEFRENSVIDPVKLVALIQDDHESFKLEGPFKIRISWKLATDAEHPVAVKKLLDRLI
ncbi:MAG: transcription-repair coupling factor [Rhodospirillaceae bacterium]|nr:transcription-repair coupling factor [Rhodospirillaceae bacterium]